MPRCWSALWQFDKEDLLAGMLLFRVLYYIMPFILSVMLAPRHSGSFFVDVRGTPVARSAIAPHAPPPEETDVTAGSHLDGAETARSRAQRTPGLTARIQRSSVWRHILHSSLTPWPDRLRGPPSSFSLPHLALLGAVVILTV